MDFGRLLWLFVLRFLLRFSVQSGEQVLSSRSSGLDFGSDHRQCFWGQRFRGRVAFQCGRWMRGSMNLLQTLISGCRRLGPASLQRSAKLMLSVSLSHRSGKKHARNPQTAANNPINSIITRISTVQLENDRTMIIKMNPPIPRRPTPMSLAIHRTRSSSSGRSGCARFAHRTMTTGRRMANTAPTTISIGNMASAICRKKTSSITQVHAMPNCHTNNANPDATAR